MHKIREGKDRVKGVMRIIQETVKDMTNEGIKGRLLEICQEVENKDEQMVVTGKIIIEKLRKCVRKLKIEESQEYPVDSLNNVMKNLEILVLDIEEKVDQISIPDK